MAKIISETLNKELEVEDGCDMKILEKEFSVPFGCEDGFCGTCQMEVLEGMENLTERNDKERDFGIEDPDRFACQCKILKGVVRIKHY